MTSLFERITELVAGKDPISDQDVSEILEKVISLVDSADYEEVRRTLKCMFVHDILKEFVFPIRDMSNQLKETENDT